MYLKVPKKTLQAQPSAKSLIGSRQHRTKARGCAFENTERQRSREDAIINSLDMTPWWAVPLAYLGTKVAFGQESWGPESEVAVVHTHLPFLRSSGQRDCAQGRKPTSPVSWRLGGEAYMSSCNYRGRSGSPKL